MSEELPLIDLSWAREFPQLDLAQYCGLWCVEELRGMQLFQQTARIDLRLHVALHAGDRSTVEPHLTRIETDAGAIALIEIEGILTKQGSSFSAAGSTILLRRAVRQAARDPEIAGLLLKVDSPGGTVAGTADLAEEVRRARESKPVFAFVEDLAASAAVWVVSQAEKVFANNATAGFGSIGTYLGLYDLSGLAAKEGIKAVVLKAGEMKAAGFPGTEITEAQRAYFQELVDDAQASFTAAVAAGRGRTPEQVAAEWVTGRLYGASQALRMGMIDGIQSFEATLAQLAATAAARKPLQRKVQKMSQETSTPEAANVPATAEQIVSACKGIDVNGSGDDARFVIDQLRRRATLEQAREAWIETLSARLASREQELARVSKSASAVGVDPVKAGGTSASRSETLSAGEEFWAAVKQRRAQGMDRRRAISETVREDHERHQAMLAEFNARQAH